MTPTTIHLATDHAGFDQKESIKTYLENKGYTVIDHGAPIYSPEDDYPMYISKAAMEVSKAAEDTEEDPRTLAIILGGSGQGEAIVANRFPHVRTTVCYGGPHAEEVIILGRQHNNANVLSLGARFMQVADSLEYIDIWLKTAFSKDMRHVRRIKELENIHTI
jgi:ribose 5-phosphate isomerase B